MRNFNTSFSRALPKLSTQGALFSLILYHGHPDFPNVIYGKGMALSLAAENEQKKKTIE
jgi:hypothetical protein